MRQPPQLHRVLLALAGALWVAAAACGPAAPASTSTSGGDARPAGPRGTVKIAWATEPENLHPKLAAGSGLNEYFWVFNSFLTYYDFDGAPHPMLAQSIPSQEAGDWVINRDGTMVTTYRLRPNARWHDGTPLTGEDFVLGFQVVADPDVPIRDRIPETLIANVTAPDEHTIVVTWKQPYVAANLLTFQQMSPLPRHLVGEKYRTNKANFIFGDEWTTGYVGTGPFRIDRWTPGAGLVARADPNWVLGPPKVETVDIRFITDAQTLVANLLAGEVDMISSPGIRAPEAAIVRDQWVSQGRGYIRTWMRQLRFLAFQFRDVPNGQPAVRDVRVRQALLLATDRQGLVSALTYDLGSVAHAFIAPNDGLFPEVDRLVTKYPYDPNRATALLAEAGWQRTTGGQLRNAAGQTLDMEIWSTPDGGGSPEAAILADNWKAVGINPGQFVIAPALQRDLELRASFPAVNPSARSVTLDNFVFDSGHLPTAEVRWQGANRGSFVDADVDRFINVALTSLDAREHRDAVLGLHKRMSEVLGIGPLFYGVEVLAAANRLKGPRGEVAEKSGMSWNIFEWEVD